MIPIIKPLEWSEPAPPTKGVSSYDHVLADTPFGRFAIEWKSWKQYDSYSVTFRDIEYIGEGSDLDEAKEIAFKWFREKVAACYEKDNPD